MKLQLTHGKMIVMELTIIPPGRGRSISGGIAEIVPNTAFATLVEGSWDHLVVLRRSVPLRFGREPNACSL